MFRTGILSKLVAATKQKPNDWLCRLLIILWNNKSRNTCWIMHAINCVRKLFRIDEKFKAERDCRKKQNVFYCNQKRNAKLKLIIYSNKKDIEMIKHACVSAKLTLLAKCIDESRSFCNNNDSQTSRNNICICSCATSRDSWSWSVGEWIRPLLCTPSSKDLQRNKKKSWTDQYFENLSNTQDANMTMKMCFFTWLHLTQPDPYEHEQ